MHFIPRSRLLQLLLGPLLFLISLFALRENFTFPCAAALGLTAWMAAWWIFRPVQIAVTALLPIVINAVFDLIPNEHIISQYFSEIVVLLFGSDLICLTWTTTGLDRRVSIRALSAIGPSLAQQVTVWLLASAALSIFLPNVVVAAIFCPIAAAMFRACGEKDLSSSAIAAPVFLAIGWGSGIGGFGSPIGSAANLVAISYIEQFTGREFMYIDWVLRFMPLLLCVTGLTLAFLLSMKLPVKRLACTETYFKTLQESFGPMTRGEKISLFLFTAATLLAFLRPLFADAMPGMKPAYIFLALGMLLFFLTDEKGNPLLTWSYAESHCMWGMMFLFASGMALGRLLIETGAVDRLSALLSATDLTGGFLTMLVFCAFATLFSEISSNTAAASVSLPLVLSICGTLSLKPVPYIIGSIVAANCAYILPISTRAIPVGYGLDAGLQIRCGLFLSLLTIFVNALLCWLLADCFSMYAAF